MADSDEGKAGRRANPRRVWTRPGTGRVPEDDDGALPFDDLHLQRYCSVWPFHKPDDEERMSDELMFIGGVARHGLRHTPIIILTVAVVFVATAELSDGVRGISPYLPPITAKGIVVGLSLVVVWVVLFWILVRMGLTDWKELYMSGVVYGLLSVFLAGIVSSIVLVYLHGPKEAPENIVFTSGYLFLILFGGLLIYDGMLRTEHMFENLQDAAIVRNKDRYQRFKCHLSRQLFHRLFALDGFDRWDGLPTVYIFSILVMTQYAVLWYVGQGPQNLDLWVTLVVNVLFNVVIVAVWFQFLLLIDEFYKLVNEDDQRFHRWLSEDDEEYTMITDGDDQTATAIGTGVEEPILTYRPFHPDGHGGYRSLGKFATRVHIILTVGGFYLVYRFIINGSRIEPVAMAPGFDPAIGWGVWLFSYALPVVFYVVAAVAWFYYSFWQLHLRMIRERERHWPDPDAEAWEYRRTAPVWPVDPDELLTILSGSISPLLFLLPI